MFAFFLLFPGILALSLLTRWNLNRVYRRYGEIPTDSGRTGAEVARAILDASDINNVTIVEQGGFLSDHYDPINRRLVLSSTHFRGVSTASVGVAAHEVGHALQHASNYQPLYLRMASVKLTSGASCLVTILPILAFLCGFLSSSRVMLLLMTSGWGIIMLFNLLTLPVEYEASRRAKAILEKMKIIRPGEETMAVNKILNAAALTYVAAFVTSIFSFFWPVFPSRARSR